MAPAKPTTAPTPTGSTVGTPSASTTSTPPKEKQEDRDGDEEMPDAGPVVTELRETLRVKLPDTFSGNRKELEVFLLQVELYVNFNEDKFPTNESFGLWTASYLRGEALRWAEPFLKDYFKHDDTCGSMAITKRMFGNWNGFKQEIRRMFGDIDEVKTAEDHLYSLKQTGSALTYSTEFQRHANQTGWDTHALISHYRRGLKSHVRMELARMERQPTNMVSLIEHAVRIDNRLYEFQKEQRTYNAPKKSHKYKGNEGRKRDNRWSDAMELDATTRKDDKKDRQFKERLCFNCDKPGHIARNCRQPKKGGSKRKGKQLNATYAKQINAVSNNEFDWDVDDEDYGDCESCESSSEEEGEPTAAGQERIQDLEERARARFPDEDIKGMMDIIRQDTLRRERKERDPKGFIPRPPLGWRKSEWKQQIQALRRRDDYVQEDEPIGKGYTELETATWLEDKLEEYKQKDFGQKLGVPEHIPEEESPAGPSNQFERRYMEQLAVPEVVDTGYESPEPWGGEDWEKRIDDLTIDLEATDADIDRLEERLAEDRLTNDVQGKLLEQLNAAEIDHPWHVYSEWKTCYTKSCPFHYEDKMRNNHIPTGKAPIYYDRRVMREIILRRRSTGQLQSKN
jgi:hypothetical protein